MKKIGEKGEKMSIRKGLTLLLLAAFGLSTIAPALAINVNSGVIFQTLAQDEGSGTSGAKDDVVVTNILFDLNNSGDLYLATSGNNFHDDTAVNFGADGAINLTGSGGTVPNPAVSLFVPPTGCRFVRLPGYTDVTPVSAIDLDDDDDHLTVDISELETNVKVTNSSNLPSQAQVDNDLTTNHIVAQVLDAAPNANITNDATAATFTNGGILAIHSFTGVDSATQNSALVQVTTKNIGIACDASSAAAVTGDINVSVLQPTPGTYIPSLPNLTTGTSIKVAEFGDNVGKLEALIAGDTTGNVTGTAEDAQVGTLISNTALQSVTTVNFGPTEETRVDGSSAFLDVDAILIRAAEQPNSTSSGKLFYQTPFATAKFVTAKQLGTDSTELINADLTNSTLFDNETNAVITVDIEIKAFDDSASSATLAVSNVFVGIDTENTISAPSGTGSVSGFLGAAAFAVTQDGSAPLSATDDAGIIAVDPGEATDFVVDGIALDGGILTQGLGFAEGTGTAPLQTNVVGADFDSVAPTATTVSFTSQATDNAFLFPGIRVDNFMNTGDGEDVEVTITDVASDNGTTIQFTTSSDAQQTAPGDEYRNSRSTFTNLLPAVATTTGAQYHLVFGDDVIATDNAGTKDNIKLGVTNLSEDTNYHQGADVLDTGTEVVANDNVILASKLTSAGDDKKFTVHILPFINKYDAVRDVISVRPKGTITLSSAALTEGVKLTATVSGNNLPSGNTVLTLANIIPSGSVSSGITGRILPVDGEQNSLLSHQDGDVTLSRSEVNPALVTGATTTTDSLDDVVGSGRVLDTNIPSFFACGLAGNTSTGTAARGPKGCVQPKARALAIEEATDGDFKAVNDLGANARIRVTLPVGADINLYGVDGTAANNYDDILNIFGTSGMTTPTVAANITNVQRVSSTVSQAFIDIDLPTTSTTTLSMLRGLYLVFRPDALVFPKGQTDLNLTLSIVDTNATDATFTDDTVLSTIATVAIAPALSQFLTVEFEQQASSAFRATTVSPAAEAFVRSVIQDKYGAQATTFPSTISNIVRFVNNDSTPDTNTLWDLKITEGAPDAFPIGTNVDGIPTVLSDQDSDGTAGFINPNDVGGDLTYLTTNGDVNLVCAASDASLFDGIDQTSATTGSTVIFSDSSITSENASGSQVIELDSDNGGAVAVADDDNLLAVELQAGTLSGASRATDETTSVTFRGLRYIQPGSTPPSADIDIACWIELDDTEGAGPGNELVIGSSIGRAFGGNATTATEYTSVYTNLATVRDQLVDARFGAAAPAATETNFNNATQLANGVFNSTFLDTNDIIDNAVTFVVDDNSSSIKLLDSNTPVSITTGTLPQVNGADVTGGDVAATVSAAAGTLQAGTLLNISTSSPNTESVVVPVLDDGSFTAVLRTAPTAQLTITQTPSTANTSANIQLKVLDVSDAGPSPVDDPAFNGTVPTLLTSSLVEGKILALFDAPATSNFTFADVEGTAVVNGTAVTKLGDKYVAVVNSSTTYTLAVTVDGETVETTLDLTTSEKTAKGKIKKLNNLKTDKNGRFVLKQKNGAKLPKDLDLEIVFSDGSTAVVANADLTRNKKGIVKFDNPDSDKTISYVQLISAKKGSNVAK